MKKYYIGIDCAETGEAETMLHAVVMHDGGVVSTVQSVYQGTKEEREAQFRREVAHMSEFYNNATVNIEVKWPSERMADKIRIKIRQNVENQQLRLSKKNNPCPTQNQTHQ